MQKPPILHTNRVYNGTHVRWRPNLHTEKMMKERRRGKQAFDGRASEGHLVLSEISSGRKGNTRFRSLRSRYLVLSESNPYSWLRLCRTFCKSTCPYESKLSMDRPFTKDAALSCGTMNIDYIARRGRDSNSWYRITRTAV